MQSTPRVIAHHPQESFPYRDLLSSQGERRNDLVGLGLISERKVEFEAPMNAPKQNPEFELRAASTCLLGQPDAR